MVAIDDAFWSLKNLVLNGVHVNPQQVVEHRTWSLMCEFRELSDQDIATLVRDEILNARGEDNALLRWATPETVARLRRTALVELVRQQRAFEAAATEQAARAPAEQAGFGATQAPERTLGHRLWAAPRSIASRRPAATVAP